MKIFITGTRGIPNILGGVETHCEHLFPLIAENSNYNITLVRRSSYIQDSNKIQQYKGIKLFEKIVFFDTYYEPLVKFQGWSFYLCHPRMLLKDFLSSNWKIAFLKKLIKLSLPVDKLYLLLLKIK